MEFRLDFDESRMTIVAWGHADAEGYHRLIEAVTTDARFVAPMRIFVDYTDLDMGEMTADAMRRTADWTTDNAAIFGDSRVAILAPTSLTFGLARVGVANMDTPALAIQVFDERAAAEAWLAA